MDHDDRGLCLITHADVEDLHWARLVFWQRGLPREELAANLPLFGRAHYSVSQRCNSRRADPSISTSITEWRKEALRVAGLRGNGSAYFRYGLRATKLTLSTTRLLLSWLPTCQETWISVAMGQRQTHAVQQTASLFDHLVGAA